MVLDSLESIMFFTVTLSAVTAAITGIIVLEAFFRNKLSQLFDDVNYLIYFFMVSGYFLYALGEVSLYLSRQVFKDTSAIGIQDIYWTGGTLLILISFVALAFNLFREHGGTAKLGTMLIVGAALVTIVIITIIARNGDRQYFFGTFYPLISSLIVTASLSVVLFFSQLGQIAKPLLLFFLSSCVLLLGDIFFSYSAGQQIYSSLSVLTDIAYFWGYTLSWAAFISLRMHLNHSAAALESKKVRMR